MAQQHYQGKKHQKHIKKMKLMETYGPATAPATTVKGYPCAICKLELNSVEQYQSHISGAKHKNQLKKSGLAPSDTLQPSDSVSGEYPEQQLSSGEDQPYGAPEDQWDGNPFAASDQNYSEEDPGFCEEYQTYSKN